MAFYIADAVMDVALQYIKDNCTKLVVLDADPAGSYSDATTANGTGSGKKLGEVTVDSTDFTIANGGSGGRKITIAEQLAVAITASGDASHVAWLNVAGTAILYVTELDVVRTGLVASSDTVDVPAHFYAIRDAVEAVGT